MALPSPCSPACGSSGVLAGVVAYVEVWSSNRTENYSQTFSQQLLNLGAKISKTFNKLVTHVVFKDGHQATWDKAIKSKVKLVSVLWVEKCRELGSHVDESLYLPINTNDGLAHVLKKKRKCMQPKDFVERTPENDRRLARRFDKLSKELEEQKSAFDAPVLLFDDSGELMYSPHAVVDRCSAMEKRIKEMKDKREHLSPTASQMSQTFDFTSLKPSLGNSPTVVGISLQDDNTERDLNTSYDELCVGAKTPEEAPSQKNKKDISNNRRLVNMTSKENRFSDSHLQKKDHDLEQKCKVPAKEISRSGDDLSTETLHTKKEMPNFVCSTFATKYIADSKGKYDTKKFGSPSLELNKRTSKNANMMKELAKPPVPSADCDSEDSCFEDYFTSFSSSSCKSRRVRFSLGSFPLKHSSSPQQAPKSKRLRLSEDFECDNSTIKKSRTKTTPTGIDFVNNAQSLISPEILPNVESCHASSKKVRASNRRTSCHQKKGAESPTTLHMKESEVVLNGHDELKRTPTDPTKLSDTVLNICHVKGLEDTLKVMPGDLEPKNERLKMATNTVLEKQEDKTSSKQSAERTPAFDTIDGLSDMFNEQQNKGALESRKTNKTKKASRSLVMTSMSSEKQNTVIQVLKTFGGFILEDNVCDTTTHVIAGSPRRTLNTLLGLARGCWILSYDWVLWSLETGYWIPEEPFELSDDFPGASIYRLQRHQSAGKYQQDLFSTLPTIFISPRSQPPCDKLSEIVLLCGGKVSKTLRQAKICVGDFSGRKPFDMRSVSEKWLLDSVTKHKVLPLEDYLFQGEKEA